MEPIEELRGRIAGAGPSSTVEVVLNPSPSAQHSLRVDRREAVQVARFLRDDPAIRLDFCSNVTGVDWLGTATKERVRKTVGDTEMEVEETRVVPGYLEVIYHLYSMTLKHGPVVLRVRTGDRSGDVTVPSLTPIWRSCEFQEREVFDLYGVRFEGHPDLRRLLMWEGFEDHPMRKDYAEPDDYEYEPTAHDRVRERAAAHRGRAEAG